MTSAVGQQLRYELILYATLAFECVYLALIAALLNTPLGWGALFAGGAVMLFFYRLLMARSGTKGEELFAPSLGSALVVIAFLIAAAGGATLPTPTLLGNALAGFARLLSGMPPTTGALIVGFILWIRVVMIARTSATLILTRDRIQWSLIVVLLLIVQGAALGRGQVMPASYGFLYIFGALLAFMLSRAHSVTQLTEQGRLALPFTLRWLLVVVGAIGGTLAAATLVTLPFSLRGARILFELAAPLRYVVGVVVAAFFYILSLILGPFLDRIPMGDFDEVFQELQSLGQVPTPTPGEVEAATGPGRAVLDLILILAFLWILALAGIYLYRLLTTNEREEEDLPPAVIDTESESFSWGPGEWLRQARDRFGKRAPRPQPGVETVRDLYKNMLLFGDEHGLPRPEEDTPYEYLTPLATRYPHRGADFERLTDAYVAAHYGESDFSDEQLRGLQAAWNRIAAEPRPLVDTTS